MQKPLDGTARLLLFIVAATAALGASLLGLGLQRSSATMAPQQAQECALLIGEGAGLTLLALFLAVARAPLRRLLAPAEPLPGAAVPSRLRLFVCSFVVLFVEIALIRYCGSQVRIFSFYRNIPLIGSFLGLGLGCSLGRGGRPQAMRFLLGLVPLAAFLAAGSLVVDGVLGWAAAMGSSEHILGDYVAIAPSARERAVGQLVMAAFCLATLVSITALFTSLGRLLGDAFDGLPRLQAYTLNILGSLAGVLAFVALSHAELPPWIWFVVGLLPLLLWIERGLARATALALVAVNALLVVPSVGDTVWSPYQKLVGFEQPENAGAGSIGPAYQVQISDVFYQVARDLSPRANAARGGNPEPHYDLGYRKLPVPPQRVLVVGAGTGNDVAAALRAGASHVDAVDINPAIVRMGRAHHPERPYDDARVSVIVDDARHAFRRLRPSSYDAVVFGLLDSHTQLGASSVRLDNYVFTRESFLAARRLLTEHGHVIVSAACFQPWFVERFRALLQNVYGNVEAFAPTEGDSWVFIARNGTPEAAGVAPGTTLPQDDWPFLYLPARRVPMAYLWTVVLLAAASVVTLKVGGLSIGGFTALHRHLFFLGAAFLLMEVHAINRLALLFGTTWMVSAATIAFVLVVIVGANMTVLAAGAVPYAFAYAGLGASLVASYVVQPGTVLGHGVPFAAGYAVLLLSPIYFAGLVFARSFAAAPHPGRALGANILGSVLGGWVEYATMAVGIRALVLLALALYACSAVSLASRKRAVT